MHDRRWIMVSQPDEVIDPSDFALESFTLPDLRDGEVRVRIQYHTIAPGVRAKMVSATYTNQLRPGDPIPGNGIGVVEASQHEGFAAGDIVSGYLGWATGAVMDGEQLERLEPDLFSDIPIAAGVGPLGLSGLTAYFGLLEVCSLKPGESVLVSSAAGSVGSMVGQIARVHDCRVLGLAGSDAKCADIIANAGYDAAINYRATNDLRAAIAGARPEGIDVFFDNVGGGTLNAGFLNLRTFGRVAVCGVLGTFAEVDPPGLPPFQPGYRHRVQGFIVHDFAAQFPLARTRIAGWLRDGRLKYRPTVIEGIEQAAEAFVGQFMGTTGPRPVVSVEASAGAVPE